MKRPAAPPTEWAEPAAPAVDAPAADPGTGISPAPAPDATPPEPPKDSWESRFKAMQADSTRRAQENADLRRRLEALEGDGADDEDEDAGYSASGDDGEQAPPSRFRPRVPEPERAHDAEADELGRSVAEAVHGPDVVAAYDKAMALLDQAVTTSDRVTAFAAFAELQSRSASQAPRRTQPADGRQSREQAVTPRVETNRPDGEMDVDLTDPGRYAAGANGGVGGWVRELLGARRNSR